MQIKAGAVRREICKESVKCDVMISNRINSSATVCLKLQYLKRNHSHSLFYFSAIL